MAKISVVIVAHTQLAFLMEAIQSVRHQTLGGESTEIIVVKTAVDDGIDEFCRKNDIVTLDIHEQGLGPKLALGLSHSSADIVSFLEDDDFFVENKLARVLSAFDHDEQLVYLRNGFTYVSADGASNLQRTTGTSTGSLEKSNRCCATPRRVDFRRPKDVRRFVSRIQHQLD